MEYKLGKLIKTPYHRNGKLLNAVEAMHYSNLANLKDKQEFLTSRVLLKALIHETLGNFVLPATALLSKSGEYYFLYNSEKIYFSISHSGEYVLVAISKTPIGVDIECVKSRTHHLLEKISSESERLNLKEYHQTFQLYIVWTMKEASMKIDQSSFNFKDYSIISNIGSNKFKVKTPKHLLKLEIFVNSDYIFSVALLCKKLL